MEISGRVTNVQKTLPSGDPYPSGLRDAPAVFRITVTARQPDGSEDEHSISYTAYTIGPIAEEQRGKIRLSFHEGRIKVGHQIRASGMVDAATGGITVAEQGDFIETSS